jgi:hypothetical protein
MITVIVVVVASSGFLATTTMVRVSTGSPVIVQSEKGDVHCRIPSSFPGFHSSFVSFPTSSCTYCSGIKDSQLTTVKAQRAVREEPLIGAVKKPTQARGGFLQCGTFLNTTTRLL